jgi:hypothetical protein
MVFAQIRTYEQYQTNNYKQNVIQSTNATEANIKQKKYFEALKLVLESNFPELTTAQAIDLLIRFDPKIVRYQKNFNPLLYAVQNCELSVLQALCKGEFESWNFFTNHQDPSELFFQALIIAATKNNIAKVRCLTAAMKQKKLDFLSHDNAFEIAANGEHGPGCMIMSSAPLGYMAYHGNVEGAKTLLKSGYSIDYPCKSFARKYTNYSGCEDRRKYESFAITPLMVALYFNKWNCAELFIQSNANLKFVDSFFRDTPLTWAIRHKAPSTVVEIMLKHRANVREWPPERTPYKIALWHNPSVLPLLKQYGADPEKEITEMVDYLKQQGVQYP